MLVVIGLLGVLFVLIFSQIPKMKEMANSAKCMNNLRSIGLAINQFAGDNNDYLPGPAYEIIFMKGNPLLDSLAPYLGTASNSAWICPSHLSMAPDYSGYKTHYPLLGYNYSPPKQSIAPPTRNYLQANYPPEKRWLLEDIDSWNYGEDARLGPAKGPIHAGFRNALFLDGRVERIKPFKGQSSALP